MLKSTPTWDVLLEKGMLDKAIEAHKKSIALKPDFVKAHHNLTFPLLNSGKLKEGLDENEWRWKSAKVISSQRHFSQPIWDGINGFLTLSKLIKNMRENLKF